MACSRPIPAKIFFPSAWPTHQNWYHTQVAWSHVCCQPGLPNQLARLLTGNAVSHVPTLPSAHNTKHCLGGFGDQKGSQLSNMARKGAGTPCYPCATPGHTTTSSVAHLAGLTSRSLKGVPDAWRMHAGCMAQYHKLARAQYELTRRLEHCRLQSTATSSAAQAVAALSSTHPQAALPQGARWSCLHPDDPDPLPVQHAIGRARRNAKEPARARSKHIFHIMSPTQIPSHPTLIRSIHSEYAHLYIMGQVPVLCCSSPRTLCSLSQPANHSPSAMLQPHAALRNPQPQPTSAHTITPTPPDRGCAPAPYVGTAPRDPQPHTHPQP